MEPEIKEKLQKLFDKEIVSIIEKDGLYYVTLDDGMFVKPWYEVDIKSKQILVVSIHPSVFHNYRLVYTREN